MTAKAMWIWTASLLMLATQKSLLAQPASYPPPVGDDRVGCSYGWDARFVTTHAFCDQYLKEAVRKHRQPKLIPSVNELANQQIARVCHADGGYDCTQKKMEISNAVAHCSVVHSVAMEVILMQSRHMPAAMVRDSIMRNDVGPIMWNNLGPMPWGLSPTEASQIVRFVYADKSALRNIAADELYARCLNERGIPYRPH